MIKRLVASFLSFIFIVVAVPFFFVFGFYEIFFDEDFYAVTLVDSTYDFMVEGVPKLIKIEKFPNLDEADYAELIKNAVSREDLSSIIKETASQLKDKTVSETGEIKLKIPLGWFSKKSGVMSEKLAKMLSEDLPECEGGMEVIANEETVTCIPKGMSNEDFEKQLKTILDNEVFADLPDNFDFTIQAPEGFEGKNIGEFFTKVFGLFFLAGAVFLLILLLLIWLTIFKPFVLVLKWWGRTLFFSTLFLLLPLVAVIFLTEVFVKSVADKNVEVMLNVFGLIYGSIAKAMLPFVVICLVASLALWIYASILVKKKKGQVLEKS